MYYSNSTNHNDIQTINSNASHATHLIVYAIHSPQLTQPSNPVIFVPPVHQHLHVGSHQHQHVVHNRGCLNNSTNGYGVYGSVGVQAIETKPSLTMNPFGTQSLNIQNQHQRIQNPIYNHAQCPSNCNQSTHSLNRTFINMYVYYIYVAPAYSLHWRLIWVFYIPTNVNLINYSEYNESTWMHLIHLLHRYL